MKRRAILFAPLLVLAACNERPAGEPVVRTQLGDPDEIALADEPAPTPTPEPTETASAPQTASACSAVTFEDVALTHCIADPAKHRIAVTYGPGDGSSPYGNLKTYAASADKTKVAFAMNGGAFSDDLKPRGYLVASKARLFELNRAEGDGNFFLKPNGVFFGTGGTWRMLATDRFYSTVRDRPQFGTQSGPMLLIDGKLHPEISANGNSRVIRNGVGLGADGRAHFVISDAPISYGQLARYFRDTLEVKNALFLDSGSSSLWDPATGRMDSGRTAGIIVVTKRGS